MSKYGEPTTTEDVDVPFSLTYQRRSVEGEAGSAMSHDPRVECQRILDLESSRRGAPAHLDIAPGVSFRSDDRRRGRRLCPVLG